MEQQSFIGEKKEKTTKSKVKMINSDDENDSSSDSDMVKMME